MAMAARSILKPEALLLDEPVASVDTESARLIRQASLAARKDWGCTLIIVSHDLAWLHECSDTRLSMANGRFFSTGEESILPPPYDVLAHGRAFKDLGNKKFIRLSAKTGDTALIQKNKIRICLSRDRENGYDNQIKARITQMLLEKKSGNILTTIGINGFSLTLSLTPDQVSTLALHPGKEVILMFHSRDISWR